MRFTPKILLQNMCVGACFITKLFPKVWKKYTLMFKVIVDRTGLNEIFKKPKFIKIALKYFEIDD